VARLESYTPAWGLPKLFRMTKGPGKLDASLFEGNTINTPSMLCVEDYLDTLAWGQSIGGLKALKARCNANAKALYDWVEKTPWIAPLAEDPKTRSNTGVCLKFTDPRVTALPAAAQKDFAAKLSGMLQKDGVGLDFNAYRDAPAGLRIWCGATVETSDIEALLPWLEWAFAETIAELQAAA
jgi:phosphoserine aminotransferase